MVRLLFFMLRFHLRCFLYSVASRFPADVKNAKKLNTRYLNNEVLHINPLYSPRLFTCMVVRRNSNFSWI